MTCEHLQGLTHAHCYRNIYVRAHVYDRRWLLPSPSYLYCADAVFSCDTATVGVAPHVPAYDCCALRGSAFLRLPLVVRAFNISHSPSTCHFG